MFLRGNVAGISRQFQAYCLTFLMGYDCPKLFLRGGEKFNNKRCIA